MHSAEQEKEARQRRMFGMTEAEMKAIIAESLLADPRMVTMSILSDAQELIALGHQETARQHINRAKWIMMEYWQRDPSAPR